MRYKYDNGNLSIKLEEELDMNSCKVLRNIMDGYIMKYQPREVEIDLSKVQFMDSSGIGLLMGRYNLTKLIDANLVITNPSNSIKRILELSNIASKITLKYNEV